MHFKSLSLLTKGYDATYLLYETALLEAAAAAASAAYRTRRVIP